MTGNKKLIKAIKKAVKGKYPKLLDEIYQYSREEVAEVNMYDQVIYIFTLQKQYAFLEKAISDKLESLEVKCKFDGNEYSVNFRVDVKE